MRGRPLIALMAAIFSASCGTSPDAEITPPAGIVTRFHDLLAAGKAADAERLLLPTDDAASRERIRKRLQKFSDDMVAKQWDFVVVDAREAGDCAVVAVDECLKRGKTAADLDPFYLVKREGRWRLLPALNSFLTPAGVVDASRVPVFRRLEQWFAGRKETFDRRARDARIPQVAKALDLLRAAGTKVVGVAVHNTAKKTSDVVHRMQRDLGVANAEELIARSVERMMFSPTFDMTDADGQRMIDGDFNDEKNRRLIAVCYKHCRETNTDIPPIVEDVIDRVDRGDIAGGIELEFAARMCQEMLLDVRNAPSDDDHSGRILSK